MANGRPLVVIGPDAIPRLIKFCEEKRLRKLLLVADTNTHGALGERVARGFEDRGFDVRTVVLAGPEVQADGDHVLRVLLGYDRADRTFLAVGSGTITDIGRIVSHRTGNSFISIPTAPSVDGYTSTNAPLIVGGIKRSLIAHAPIAVFADIGALSSAPRPMIAAGFGDMIGKYTSVADWRLGSLLWDQPYDESIARRALDAAGRCAEQAKEIGKATPEGVRRLMEELIESGFCMMDFGSSLPASGTEHYYSHCWEMKLLREGRPAILHGAKVGVAAILVAGLHDRIRRLTERWAGELLEAFRPPAREGEVRRIRSAFGPIADEIVAVQAPFLNMSGDDFEGLKRKILDKWPQIQEIARQVPTARRLTELIHEVGGPVDAKGLGLTEEDLALATDSGHYLRGYFTVRRLAELLNQSFDHLGDGEAGRQSGRLDAHQVDET